MGFHRLPVSRYSQDSNKRVIVKFNRKYPEALLKNKKSISSKDFSHLNLFVLTTLPLYLGQMQRPAKKRENLSILLPWHYYNS